MRFLMTILGYLTGKTAVWCAGCKNLIDGKCYGKVLIPEAERTAPRVCGFFKDRA